MGNTVGSLGLVAASICLILAVSLLSTPSKAAWANRFLAGFLMLTAIDMTGWFLGAVPTPLRLFRATLGFLQMPLFLGYFVAACRADLRFRPAWLLHLLPFAIANVVLAPRFYLGLWGAPSERLLENPEFLAIEICLEAQYYIYALAACRILRRYRTIFLERYSDARSKLFIWLFQLLGASLVAHALVTIRTVLEIRLAPSMMVSLVVPFVALAVTVWVAIKALRHPELFRGIDGRLQRVAELAASGGSLTSAAEDNATRLRFVMERDAPYLDPELSLETLSQRLGMSPRALSLLINYQLGVRFFDFVNAYRVRRAQHLLATSEARSNLLQVMFEAGFNSKSSFNTAFRKHAGMTPSQYRRRITAEEVPSQKMRPTS